MPRAALVVCLLQSECQRGDGLYDIVFEVWSIGHQVFSPQAQATTTFLGSKSEGLLGVQYGVRGILPFRVPGQFLVHWHPDEHQVEHSFLARSFLPA